MKIPFLDLAPQHRALGRQLKHAVSKVIDSRQFVLKDNVAELERRIVHKTGAKYALGLASGTDALLLSLQALGVGSGDEVITTPFTFFATAGSISRTRAKPVFADIHPRTFNLDVANVAKKITRRTKAIMPVHLFGLPCDMADILALAGKKRLAVIEDAAQSLGARYDGRETGSMGDTGCYSFYPTKNLGGAGDGGMLVTSSDELYRKIKILRDHGAEKKYYHQVVGMNSRLDEIQAAVLLVKLKYLDKWNQKRASLAELYEKALKGTPVQVPVTPADRTHIYHLYSILAPRRDELATHLTKKGIGCGVYYPLPMHFQECYRALGYKKGDLPVTERVCGEILSLPMYPELGAGNVKKVAAEIRAFYKGRRS